MVDPEVLRAQLARIPFAHAAGLRLAAVSAAEAVVRLAMTPAVTAPGCAARLDDGIIAMAADQAASIAAWGALGFPLAQATLSLSVSYLAPVVAGGLVVRAALAGRVGPQAVLTIAAETEAGVAVARGTADFFLGRFPGSTGAADGGFPPAEVAPVAALAGGDLAAALGVRRVADGLVLPWDGRVQGSSVPAALHGGAIAACAGLAAREALEAPAWRLAHAATSYLRGGLPRESVFRAAVVARTRQTALVRVETMQEGGSRHVATSLFRYCA